VSRHLEQPGCFTRAWFCALSLGLFASGTGCVSSSVESSAPPLAAQDTQYEPVLSRWTRKSTVFSQFQNRVEMSAVLLTNDMRQAVTQRLSRLRGSADGISVLSDSSGGVRLGVLVSVFTPESAYANLDDRTLWSLSMRIGPSQLSPMYVRRITDKTLLQTFFPNTHQWSQDYLMVFDFPETILQRDSEKQKETLNAELLAQSALAKVQLRWP
jgi:hypothetical protein